MEYKEKIAAMFGRSWDRLTREQLEIAIERLVDEGEQIHTKNERLARQNKIWAQAGMRLQNYNKKDKRSWFAAGAVCGALIIGMLFSADLINLNIKTNHLAKRVKLAEQYCGVI